MKKRAVKRDFTEIFRRFFFVQKRRSCTFAIRTNTQWGMNLSFKDKKMEKYASDYRKCKKELGSLRAELFMKRLGDLYDASSLECVRYLPGNYHELKGNRKGEWACDLDQPYRLIFRPHENPIPTDEHGRYLWVEIVGVELIEITNYHGK